MSYFNNLPDLRLPAEIVIRIMKYLDINDLFCFRLCSKWLFNLSKEMDIWYPRITKEFPWYTPLKNHTINYFDHYFTILNLYKRIKSRIYPSEPNENQFPPGPNKVKFIINQIPYPVMIKDECSIILKSEYSVILKGVTAYRTSRDWIGMIEDGWCGMSASPGEKMIEYLRTRQYRKCDSILNLSREEIDFGVSIGLITITGIIDS